MPISPTISKNIEHSPEFGGNNLNKPTLPILKEPNLEKCVSLNQLRNDAPKREQVVQKIQPTKEHISDLRAAISCVNTRAK